MTKNTSVATVKAGEIVEFNAILMPPETQEKLRKEMDGLRTPPPPRIKVPAGGGIAFEVPTEDPDNPDSMKELNCIILAHHPVNRYYIRGMDEGAESAPPDCMSLDGKTGYGRQDAGGEVLKMECESCPLNHWGSGKGGVGRACSNRHRLYLLLEAMPLPFILEVPPTSVKNLAAFVQNLYVYRGGAGTHSVVTKLSLRKTESKTGVKYAELQFSFAGKLPIQMAQAAEAMGNDLMQRIKDQTMVNTLSDFVPLDESEDNPFNLSEVF